MALINLREQLESGEPAEPSKGPRRPSGQGPRRDERVVAIQQLLINHQLPVGSKSGEPDGFYGEITNRSLYKFANSVHTDAKIKEIAKSIKPYIDAVDFKKTIPNITTIHAFVQGKTPVGEVVVPKEEREIYDLVVYPKTTNEFTFPIMAAVRSVKNLDYIMRLYKMINDDDPLIQRANDVKKWVRILSDHMTDPAWIGARTLLQDYGMVIEEGYRKQAKDPRRQLQNVKIIDYMKARFPIEMGKIHPNRYPELTAFLYSVSNGKLTDNEMPSALIKNPGMLSSMHPVMIKQLTEMVKHQEGRRGYA